eukprot:TRINITY_DN1278_c0_g1_i1.p1 TRINITY_DN1278_c0_g1~~TRINITY_DN1278_c0_g1_i1.p1  ORF type:complete len:435 (+),score=97.45 TRINITY_DN1278_c0_g1_i1:40-1344(+)
MMLAAATAATVMAAPEQIHLSHKTSTNMWVSWADRTVPEGSQGTVALSGSGTGTYNAVSKAYQYQSAFGEAPYTSPSIFHAVVNVTCGKSYSYKVTSGGSTTSPISFKTLPCADPNSEIVIALTGDLGQTVNSSATIDHIATGMQQSTSPLQMLWLVGDLSYADAAYGRTCTHSSGCNPGRWDSWGNMVQKVTQQIPIMVGPGNHEQEDSPTPKIGAPYVAFTSRMKGPDGANAPYWWSMEVGPVHMITMNSYMDYSVGSDQYNWLVADLKTVDRLVTPWLVVGLHAPWYNSNTHHHNETEEWGMRVAMEPLLAQAKVDVLFCGHVHAYERSHPVYNYKPTQGAMIEINIGDGGNREVLEADPADWRQPQPDWSAFRQNKFGHGRFHVYNTTHAHWSWHTIDTPEAVESDTLWFVRNEDLHGVQAYPTHNEKSH